MDKIKELEATIEYKLFALRNTRETIVELIEESEGDIIMVYHMRLARVESAIEELDSLLDYINESFQ